MQPLDPVTPKSHEIAKAEHPFINDSIRKTSRLLTGPLLANILYFSSNEKDQINEETLELLEPYLDLRDSRDPSKKLFDPEIAKATSAALWGLSTWTIGIRDYAKQNMMEKHLLA